VYRGHKLVADELVDAARAGGRGTRVGERRTD
jgi:hypothetical protein